MWINISTLGIERITGYKQLHALEMIEEHKIEEEENEAWSAHRKCNQRCIFISKATYPFSQINHSLIYL